MDNQISVTHTYVNLLTRIKAIFADMVVVVAFMATCSLVFSNFENFPDWIRAVAFTFIFLLYDPLLTTILGGTLGHRMYGICIRKENNENQNINFFQALIRFIAKFFLGILSLVTVTANSKNRAIHDFLSGSVAIKEPQE
jgi:uncharacterized RDD family membrane protein YckC